MGDFCASQDNSDWKKIPEKPVSIYEHIVIGLDNNCIGSYPTEKESYRFNGL